MSSMTLLRLGYNKQELLRARYGVYGRCLRTYTARLDKKLRPRIAMWGWALLFSKFHCPTIYNSDGTRRSHNFPVCNKILCLFVAPLHCNISICIRYFQIAVIVKSASTQWVRRYAWLFPIINSMWMRVRAFLANRAAYTSTYSLNILDSPCIFQKKTCEIAR